MDPGAPVGFEAVGDLADHHRRPGFTLRGVVGRGYFPTTTDGITDDDVMAYLEVLHGIKSVLRHEVDRIDY